LPDRTARGRRFFSRITCARDFIRTEEEEEYAQTLIERIEKRVF